MELSLTQKLEIINFTKGIKIPMKQLVFELNLYKGERLIAKRARLIAVSTPDNKLSVRFVDEQNRQSANEVPKFDYEYGSVSDSQSDLQSLIDFLLPKFE